MTISLLDLTVYPFRFFCNSTSQENSPLHKVMEGYISPHITMTELAIKISKQIPQWESSLKENHKNTYFKGKIQMENVYFAYASL